MKAGQARELANHKLKEPLDSILVKIKKAAEQGKLQIWYYESISELVREELTKLGYSVGETRHDRNDILTSISWEK